MRTLDKNGEPIYCAGSRHWVPGAKHHDRRECPVCGDAVLVTRVSELRTHFAPGPVNEAGFPVKKSEPA